MHGCPYGYSSATRLYSYQVLPPDSTWKAPCRRRDPAPEVRTDKVAASIFAACLCECVLAGTSTSTSASYERWSTAAGPSRFIAAAHPIGRGQGKLLQAERKEINGWHAICSTVHAIYMHSIQYGAINIMELAPRICIMSGCLSCHVLSLMYEGCRTHQLLILLGIGGLSSRVPARYTLR